MASRPPLPDAGDFRVSLGEEEKDRVKRQMTASVEASLTVASRELWQRIYEAVAHMAGGHCVYSFSDTNTAVVRAGTVRAPALES